MLFESVRLRYRQKKGMQRLFDEWMALRGSLTSVQVRSGPRRRVAIVPSDPLTLVGAKGDEAMMTAVIGALRLGGHADAVSVLTGSDIADQAALDLRFEPLRCDTSSLSQAFRKLAAFNPDAVVLIGADVMDGYYSPATSGRFLALSDLMARSGASASFMGFSFNALPNRELRRFYADLSPSVRINVRDPISLERLKRFVPLEPELVADCAFLLRPVSDSPAVTRMRGWLQARRKAGHRVFGFNMHPMLFRQRSDESLQRLLKVASVALIAAAREHQVSFSLVDHDYRGEDGDAVCMQPLYEICSKAVPDCFYRETQQMSAAELKGVAGLLDGVVTGRMHLAIASLGQGTPVAGLTYQDKFHGLFRWFDLPPRFLLSPDEILEPGRLQKMLFDFIDQAPALAEQVRANLPRVSAASAKNVERVIA